MKCCIVVVVASLLLLGCQGSDESIDTTPPTIDATTTPLVTATTTTITTTTMTTTAAPSSTLPLETTTSTTIGTSTTTLPSVASLEAGLFCRDLVALGYNYELAVAYWTREGNPNRMDADRNGIPCETVYQVSEVLAFWGDPLPTTTQAPDGTTTVAAAVGWVQGWIDDEFARSEPPPGIIGPSQLECGDSGTINVGDVFACMLRSNTASDFELEDAGIVIYVLDATGKSAWSVGTDVPGTTAGLIDVYAVAPHGLFCRDLLNPDVQTYSFSAYSRPANSGFFWSLVYWSLEGEPERMDADRNGIPCETLYEASTVASVLDGGPTY